MKHAQLLSLADEIFGEVRASLDTKGRDYSSTEDSLAHFRKAGLDLGLRPEEIWGVLFRKHVSAIYRHVRDGKVDSEGLRSRIMDAIAYLVLYLALTEGDHE